MATVERLTKLKEVFDSLENWELMENELDLALESDESDIGLCLFNVEQAKSKLKLAWVDLKFQLKKEKEDAEKP